LSQSGNIKSKLFGLLDQSENDILDVDAIDIHSLKFDPSQYFIPGWKGEGLITAHGLTIKSILNNLTIDSTSLFKKLCSSTNSMRKQTHEEFLSFAKWSNIDSSHFVLPSDFWFHFQDESSPYQNQIQEFVRIFCFRAVAIYLFRIKFILELSKELRIEISEDNLFNPLSFLGRIFKKNSSTELHCESLQINQYSWYRPTQEYRDSILKIQEAFSNVTLTELIKLLSTPKEYKIYSIKNYSHALSHQSFGQFINGLVLQFPKWLNSEDGSNVNKNFHNQKSCILPNTINTLFEGNHVSSLALSHWLAQETNVQVSQWDNIICPNFRGNEFIDGTFLKICQELQFLSFLTKVAIIHCYEVVPFICKIMKDKNANQIEEHHEQFSLLDLAGNAETQSFNRIILNLIDQPKTNPHHSLVSQILAKKASLKKDGFLFVLSNQKLFVPSHSERVELLLKDFKLHASINLDELKGKGEIPHYIYVLTKRSAPHKQNPHLFKINRSEKESCHTFQLKGNLTRFNLFSNFVNEFEQFTKSKKANSTPIYINELDDQLTFEFHIDAIIEGKLVSSSTNKENGQHIHLSYFKNLTKTSVPLDTFFHMDNLNPSSDSMEKNIATELLGVKTGLNKQYQLLLIVNQENPHKIDIELVPIESFKAKIEEHGTVFYTYFGMTPKHSSINLNVFREYFNSAIGNQIIQMQLSDGPAKLKGKLRSLLIPSFFAKTQFLPEEYKQTFSFLETNHEDLLKLDPTATISKMEKIEENFNLLKTQYPWHLLGLLSHFKQTLNNSISEIEENKVDEFQFSNPFIANELVKLKTYSIYPKNNDIYISLETKNPNDLKLPLSSLVMKFEDESYSLTLKSNNQNILTMFANESMIQFLKFIIQNGVGYKISDILLGLQVPTASELDMVLSKFSVIKDNKLELKRKVTTLINQIFQEQVSR
jgi:hypothetical protein